MGRGQADAVHTALHRRMAEAAGLRPPARSDQPAEALSRAALGPVLATNRSLQPELIGALGLIELQAGPRCRKVVAGLRRVGAPAETFPFYEEHAAADPIHGRDWLDHIVAPLASDPAWATGMIRGATWRLSVNDRFFTASTRELDLDLRHPMTAA